MSDLTTLLDAAAAGDRRAAADLLPLVYDELRKLAAARMAGENPDHTLEATALVHEAYLRLTGAVVRVSNSIHTGRGRGDAAHPGRSCPCQNCRQAGRPSAAGAAGRSRPLDRVARPPPGPGSALTRFAVVEPRKAELVVMRFFAGRTIPEAALALGVSVPTAERWWAYARTWLYADLDGENPRNL